MMDKRERLAIAALHGSSLEKRGKPELTARDIAGAMGMGHLSKLQAELLYAKYCGYPRSGLWSLTLLEIEAWRPDWLGHGIAHRVAKVALDIIVPPERQPGQAIPSHKCQHCGGTGTDYADAKRPECGTCGGSGAAQMPDFGRVWNARLDELILHLGWLEDEAIERIWV